MGAKKTHPLDERSGKLRSPSMRKLAGDGKSWTPTEARAKARLMRQFLKRDGQQGNSQAFQEGWERIFGGKA